MTDRRRDVDPGLGQTLKRKFFKVPPDPRKVKEFGKMLSDPRMRNRRGTPRYSKIFREYGVDSYDKGYTAQEMAAPQFPEEVDIDGCPSKQAVESVKGYLKRLTRKFKGNLELYSTPGVRGIPPYRRESRWHITKYKRDHDKQVDAMLKISKSIELSAKERQANFKKKTYPERMEKVDLLDRFFETEE